MREYGLFRWKLRGTFKVSKLSDAKLMRFQPKADHNYFSACVQLRKVQAQEKRLNAKVRRFKTVRDLVRTEVGLRKAQKCPCHIITGKKTGNILCLARKRDWVNQYKEGEFYFWICSYCTMGENYKATKALMARLAGEYTKHMVTKGV